MPWSFRRSNKIGGLRVKASDATLLVAIGSLLLASLACGSGSRETQSPTATPTRTPRPTPTLIPLIVAPSATLPPAIATEKPTATSTDMSQVAVTIQPTSPAEMEDWRLALADHLSKTVCSPTTDAAYPRPEWCDKLLGFSLVSGVLTVRTSATTSEEAELISRGISSFAFNNLYKQFGIKNLVIVSDADGKTLFKR